MIQGARPLTGKEELKNIAEVLKSGWLGMGDRVFLFENKLKKMFGRKYAICVNTGTTAIHLALDSIGIKKGDEVIVPSLTFIGSIQPILYCGGIPRFCDINTDDLNIDINHLEKLINKKTKAILPVHYGGNPCDMEKILKIAKKHRIHVIEDAAHAFGSKYKNKLIGSFGDISCFSFDPIKNITCGEGGALLLNDEKIAQKAIKKRILGIDNDTWNRYKHKRSWLYNVQMEGYRYHMSNISGAIGLAQLEKFDKFAKTRKDIARFYDKNLSDLKEVKLLKRDAKNTVPFNYTILAEKRDALMTFLKENKIVTIINYIPNHLQPLFKNKKIKLKNTESVYKKIISIPMHAGLTKKDAKEVIMAIKKFYSK